MVGDDQGRPHQIEERLPYPRYPGEQVGVGETVDRQDVGKTAGSESGRQHHRRKTGCLKEGKWLVPKESLRFDQIAPPAPGGNRGSPAREPMAAAGPHAPVPRPVPRPAAPLGRHLPNRKPRDSLDPQVLRDALVSIEDKDFYTHSGINIWRIVGAAYRDIESGGKVQGASTLTMQLARNLFLSPDRSFYRKVQESLLAIQIERRFTCRPDF